MDADTAQSLAAMGMIGTVFMLVLGLLWVLVPFAIFGIKPLLRELLREQKRTNELLSARAAG